MNDTTPEQNAKRVIELSEKATKGPWHLMPEGFESRNKYPTVYATDDELRYIADFRDFMNFHVVTPNLANAEFTSFCRTAAPELARVLIDAIAALEQISTQDAPKAVRDIAKPVLVVYYGTEAL